MVTQEAAIKMGRNMIGNICWFTGEEYYLMKN